MEILLADGKPGSSSTNMSDHALAQALMLKHPEIGNDLSKLLDYQMMDQVDPDAKREMELAFLARGPLDNSWLSNFDIDEALSRLTRQYQNFGYLGAVPSNCDQYKFCSIRNFDFADHPDLDQFGIVFNRDKVGEPGSHWVSVFFCAKEGLAQFCDSAGDGPSGTMDKIIKKFCDHYHRTKGRKVVPQINNKSYQKDGYSCGIYSYHFIRARLAGVSWDKYFQNAMGKEIAQCRKVIFRGAEALSDVDPRCIPETMLT